jgi:adenine-specific DNA methylase
MNCEENKAYSQTGSSRETSQECGVSSDSEIKERRRLGKFETPQHIARFITRWAIKSGNEIVLEPCIGTGILLSNIIERIQEIQGSKAMLTNIHGVDIDQTAIDSAALNLGLDDAQKSKLICMDFLEAMPNRDIPLVDAVICNPPYSKHQLIERNYKNRIARELEEKANVNLSRQSSIYIYFLIHAASFLKRGGRMAFVLPGNFLEVNYGIPLKRFLVRSFRIAAIVLFPRDSLQFPDVLTTTCVALLEKGKKERSTADFVSFNFSEKQRIVDSLKTFQVYRKKRLGISVKRICQDYINPELKWINYFEPKGASTDGQAILGSIARCKRGIATGANDFFVLSENEVAAHKIERTFLKPVLTKTRYAQFLTFTSIDFANLKLSGARVWLLSTNWTKEDLRGTNLLKYIKMGEIEGLNNRYLTSSRKIWYSSENRSVPPVLFTYMSRDRPRFIWNEARTLVLNTFHCVYIQNKIRQNQLMFEALLACLNSTRTASLLKRIGRTYGGGLLKVEPRELAKLPIYNIMKFSEEELNYLSKLFRNLCLSERKGEDEDGIRDEIDEALDSIEY